MLAKFNNRALNMSISHISQRKIRVDRAEVLRQFNICYLNKYPMSININMPKVLLVEDNAVIQKAHRAFLQELNCQVDIASNGLQALSLYESNNYDIVLLDIDLPDMKGTAISKKIRYLNDKQHIPIIAVTALKNSTQQFYKKAGINAVIYKPVSLKMLKQVLSKWL